jgi:hypothetical protein
LQNLAGKKALPSKTQINVHELRSRSLLSENPIMPPFVASRAHKLTSKTMQVMLRFGLRMAAILAFGVFGGIGFERGLTVMLWMSTILCGVIATFDREEPLDTALNHWDEAMVFAALCCLACTFEFPVQLG